MTNDAMTSLLACILDKLNRIEAAVIDMKSAAHRDKVQRHPIETKQTASDHAAAEKNLDQRAAVNEAVDAAIAALGKSVAEMISRQHKPDRW